MRSYYVGVLVLLAAIAASCGSQSTTGGSGSCTDGVKNGNETGVDCGGGTCLPCQAGSACATSSDCVTGVCTAGACAAPSCTDGVKNGGETGTDCGGTCPACAAGQGCQAAADCQSGVCTGSSCQSPSCTDGVKNGNETDVDCGGGACPACAVSKACVASSDCQAPDICLAQRCAPPSCTDGVKDGSETDVDCGGGACPACVVGKTCGGGADCQTGVCSGASCQAATCTDGVKNGTESDVDCGGGACPACAVGQACAVSTDCNAAVCTASACAYAQSCNALLSAQPAIASGAYSILPSSAASAFPVYCDMTDSGGGWTLVMKINGTQADHIAQNFSYDSALWTNATTLNPTSTDLTVSDAKFASFAAVPFTQILGVMTPGTATATLPFAASSTLLLTPPGSWSSLMSLMQQPVNTVVFSAQNAAAAVVTQWTGLTTPAATVQANCNWPGVNMESANCGGFPPSQMARVRLGLITNQENDCCSPDSYTGFGGAYTYAGCYPTDPWYGPAAGSAGGTASCTGGGDVQNMGYLFVR